MNVRATTVPLAWQVAGCLAALWICWWGLQGLVAEWPADLAMLEFGWLLLGLVVWNIRGTRRPPQAPESSDLNFTRRDLLALGMVMGVSLGLSIVTGTRFAQLPPAYHDEYSYLFQAQSILEGRWTWPTPARMPDLFDQFHVLNEGRMASRYYPGTGTWLAPWLWLGHPYWGQWVAGAAAAGLVYLVGRELDGRLTGFVAGVIFAAAPGPALFSNLLLAHHATLLALMIFLYGFVRGQRTKQLGDYLLSGVGLGAALLCRPATAAGFGLPFGVWCLAFTIRQLRSRTDTATDEHQKPAPPPTGALPANLQSLVPVWFGYGLPLAAAIGIAGAYNSAATGNWRTSPYQLYTDIYTPRHVYGFNNVLRGEQRLGPKVLDDYDRWAENLTPESAAINVRNRVLISGLWTMGLPLLVLTGVLSLPLLWSGDPRWRCVAWGVVSLHAIHVPYWYVGIMGWHYVFETSSLWCLLAGHAASRLILTWRVQGRWLLMGWSLGLPVLAWSGMYATFTEDWEPRWMRGVSSIAFPREQHAQFQKWVADQVGNRPALVLIDQTASNPHLDLVVNDAGLQNRILLGRYRPGRTNLAAVVAAYPERDIFVARPAAGQLIPAEKLIETSDEMP